MLGARQRRQGRSSNPQDARREIDGAPGSEKEDRPMQVVGGASRAEATTWGCPLRAQRAREWPLVLQRAQKKLHAPACLLPTTPARGATHTRMLEGAATGAVRPL